MLLNLVKSSPLYTFGYLIFVLCTGSTSAQIGGPGSQNQRPHSPSRRGGSSSVGAGPASLGPRHQRAGGLPGAGYNRNAETSDWRYHREASHEDYTSSSYQQPQQSFDRWGNDFNRSGIHSFFVLNLHTVHNNVCLKLPLLLLISYPR